MTEPKFTKGPWLVEPHGETYALYSRRTPSEHGLRLMNLDDGDYNFVANFRLIATAPDLYEALEALLHGLALNRSDSELLVDYGTLGLDCITRACAAIAKADGGGADAMLAERERK